MIEELQVSQAIRRCDDPARCGGEKAAREYGLTDERLKPWEEEYLNSLERDI
jgi:hypothetical protein